MDDLFVVEREVMPGVWELVNDVFYSDKKDAIDAALTYMDLTNKQTPARYKKLTMYKK